MHLHIAELLQHQLNLWCVINNFMMALLHLGLPVSQQAQCPGSKIPKWNAVIISEISCTLSFDSVFWENDLLMKQTRTHLISGSYRCFGSTSAGKQNQFEESVGFCPQTPPAKHRYRLKRAGSGIFQIEGSMPLQQCFPLWQAPTLHLNVILHFRHSSSIAGTTAIPESDTTIPRRQ